MFPISRSTFLISYQMFTSNDVLFKWKWNLTSCNKQNAMLEFHFYIDRSHLHLNSDISDIYIEYNLNKIGFLFQIWLITLFVKKINRTIYNTQLKQILVQPHLLDPFDAPFRLSGYAGSEGKRCCSKAFRAQQGAPATPIQAEERMSSSRERPR